MKLTVLLLCISFLGSLAVESYSQTTRLTVNFENTSIKQILNQIEEQSEFRFFYSGDVDVERKASISQKEKVVTDVLNELFNDTDIKYRVLGRQIALFVDESENTMLSSFQQKNISGKVSDATGMPLPGVTVVIKGTTQGTITGADGTYNLANVPSNAVLVFSFIGMETKEVSIAGKETVNISMEEETIGIEEVVAVGYGTMKKSDLTGSITSVDQARIKDIPATTIDQKLVGQVSGVQIQQVSGAPGAGLSVKIRGNGSIGAGNDPLYVVDGMPYSSSFNQNLNPLVYLNPNDIETITILKDASSTAIYGSRGANGVIMITTKKGDFDRTEINVSSMMGVQQVPQQGRPDMMDQYQFAELQREKITKMVLKMENRAATDADIPSIYLPANLSGKGTDWYDLILQTALVQDHNVSILKGTKDSRLNFSMGYYNQKGVLKYTGLERFSGKLTMESNLGNSVKVGASLQPTFIKQDRANTNSDRTDVIGIATWANPVLSPYDENGELIPYLVSPTTKFHSAWSFANPLFTLREVSRQANNFQNLGLAFIEWEITKGLKAKSSLNTNYSVSKYFEYTPSTVGGANVKPAAGTGKSSHIRTDNFNWLIENTVNYNKTINNHKFDALIGYTVQKDKGTSINIGAGPYANDLIHTINAAQDISSWGESLGEWSMISYLGRINYSFKDRYYFTSTFRSDGSSRFGEKRRFGFFPSMAMAWRVSEEDFLKNSKIVENLKLRLSYGKSGNNNIGNYAHLASIGAGSYIFGATQVTASSVGISNPYLTWEESDQIDAGFDLGMFNNRLSVVVDYYYRKTQNMLLSDVIPAITGFNTQTVNKGNVRNTGLELSIGGTPVDSKIKWNINLNVSLNRNKVISTNENGDRILAGSINGNPTHVTVVGKPIGQFFGFIYDGVYSKEDILNPSVPKYSPIYEGAIKFKDLNEDGVISELLDYTIIGDPYPDFIYGITNNFSYKNFDLSVVINGQYGGAVVNALRMTVDNIQGFFNVSQEWVNRWKSVDNPGDGKHYGVPTVTPSSGHKISNLWIEDATFLRIANVTAGYSLPKQLMRSTGFINNCRIYMSIQNLAMFTKYGGANPEAQSRNQDNVLCPGFDMTSYPLARTVSFGINLSF